MPDDKEFELDDLEAFSFDDISLEEEPTVPATEGEDPFGVWVKSAPEEVVSESTPAPAPDDSLPEDDFLSTEELAKLDDSFDFVTVSDEPLEGETPLEDEIAFLNTPAAVSAETETLADDAAFDEVSLDDFVSFDDAATSEETPSDGSFLVDPDSTGSEEEGAEEFLDIDIEIEDDIGDDELEIIEGAAPKADFGEEVSLDSFSAEEVDLSEFGDFDETEVLTTDEPTLEPQAIEVAGLEAPLLEEPLLEAPEVHEDGFFEETILDDAGSLPSLDVELPVIEDTVPVPMDLEPDDQTDLDHIMALEEDLTSGIRTEDEAEPDWSEVELPSEPLVAKTEEGEKPASAPTDMAALILEKIEQELSSIKREISELKKEVTHLRTAPEPTPSAGNDFLPPAESPTGEAKPHGFFDEEDDETIALTGDELDNILSTAEISEGEEPGVSLDEDLLTMDADGNLIEPEELAEPAFASEPVEAGQDQVSSEVLHVTDEEFLAGTALDLNEPDLSLDGESPLGIPDSIELEEGLPEGLDADDTEDLLITQDESFEEPVLPEGLMEPQPEALEIPIDEELALELDAVSEAEVDVEGWSPAPVLPAAGLATDSALETEKEDVVLPPPPRPTPAVASNFDAASVGGLSPSLKDELKAVLQYMDKLLASLPDDKIQEFAESEHFEVYKRLFEELGLIE